MDTSSALPQIDETLLATTRYLQALTELDDESAGRPSVLPGWSRAHVVAHLSRNADAITRVLTAVAAGAPAAMYPSSEQRNQDIEQTVVLPLDELLEDARTTAARLATALAACVPGPDARFGRVDGDGSPYPLDTLVPRRRAEVEIHHSDLDLGYSPASWPADFSTALIGQRQDELAATDAGGPSMVLSATDVDGLWKLGAGHGPEVRGTAGELAWWLVGRPGAGLTCEPGPLPTVGGWR